MRLNVRTLSEVLSPSNDEAVRVASQWANRAVANAGTYTDADYYANLEVARVALFCGITDANCRLNLFAGSNLAAALTPLFRGGGPDTDTNVNFVSGDYTRATGITGNGSSKYLNTQVPVSTFSATSRHIGVYLRSTTEANRRWWIGAAGTTSTDNPFGIREELATPNGTQFISSATTVNGPVSNSGTQVGLMLGTSIGTSHSLYNAGTFKSSQTFSPSGTSSSIFVFSENINGTASSYSVGPLGGYSVGPGLTAAQVTAITTAWQTSMTILGRAM